jgi:hypothetical protein
MDRTVLLIDADVAKPHIPEYLGIMPTGHSMCRTGSEAVRRADQDRYRQADRAAAGRPTNAPPTAGECCPSRLVGLSAARYPDRIILFDSPPLLTTSESACWPPMGRSSWWWKLKNLAGGSARRSVIHHAVVGMLLNKTTDPRRRLLLWLLWQLRQISYMRAARQPTSRALAIFFCIHGNGIRIDCAPRLAPNQRQPSATYTDNATRVKPTGRCADLGVRRAYLSSQDRVRCGLPALWPERGAAAGTATPISITIWALSATPELIEDFLFIDGSARIAGTVSCSARPPTPTSTTATAPSAPIRLVLHPSLAFFANAQALPPAARSSQAGADSAPFLFRGANQRHFRRSGWGQFIRRRKTAMLTPPQYDTTFGASAAGCADRKFGCSAPWAGLGDYLSASDIDRSVCSVGFGWAPTRPTVCRTSAANIRRHLQLLGGHRPLVTLDGALFGRCRDISQQFLTKAIAFSGYTQVG